MKKPAAAVVAAESGNKHNNPEVSSVMMVCLLFLVHTFTNSLLLSPLAGQERCLFWNQATCSADEAWIANWFAVSHFHVAVLLSGLAYACHGSSNNNNNSNNKNGKSATASAAATAEQERMQVTLSYLIAVIVLVYLTQGIFASDLLNVRLAQVQTVVFLSFLAGVGYFSAQWEQNLPRIPLLPSATTSLMSSSGSTSSFGRQKMALSTIALGAQLVGSLFRTLDMALGEGKNGYLGDMSSPVYQCISNMALCDMMIHTVILGVTLRFFTPDQQKVVLWAQVAALMVSQAMLAGEQGEMIPKDQIQAGGIGCFVSIVAATLGAL